jgi:hypothetical protein
VFHTSSDFLDWLINYQLFIKESVTYSKLVAFSDIRVHFWTHICVCV